MPAWRSASRERTAGPDRRPIERLAAQWARLRRANTFKSEILGTVAHDLKNPLGVILGRTEMLKEMIAAAGALDGNVQAQIELYPRRRQSAHRDGGRSGVRRHGGRARHHHPARAGRHRRPGRGGRRGQPAARRPQGADAHRRGAGPIMRRCAMPTGSARRSTIWSAMPSNTARSAAAIDLLVARDAGGIVVEVRDQGAGLSPEDISRLFGRFQRLSAKPTAGESSTGLGLSIVKRIVDLHGGRIAVESAGPGKGATFKMTLPVTTHEPGAAHRGRRRRAARPRDGRRLSAHARLQRQPVRRRREPAPGHRASRCRT